MSEEIIFDDKKFNMQQRSRSVLVKSEIPKILKFLIDKKIVKNENQAAVVVVCLIVALFGVSIYLINRSVGVTPAIPSPSLNIIANPQK